MRAGTTVRLAVAGTRVDGLRLALTLVAAALATVALLCALTVALIGPSDGPYTPSLLAQSGLHPGVVVALAGLAVPALVLLAQCSRIGGPARDRRLTTLRLAGATPRETARIVSTEATVASLAGALVGTGVYYLLRGVLGSRVVDRRPPFTEPDGRRVVHSGPGFLRLPTDVAIPWWSAVAVVVGLVVLVVAGTLLTSRRVTYTPFAVLRATRRRPPAVAPLVSLVAGVGGFFAAAALADHVGDAVLLLVLVVAFVLTVGGLLSGQGALTHAIGTRLAARTSRPALLLAGRRMIAEPFATTRATGVLTIAVIVAAGAQQLRHATVASYGNSSDGFYTATYDLVDLVLLLVAVLAGCGLLVAAGEGIVARRRTYAAVVAAGTPRRVVARAVLAEVLLPLTASLVIGALAGILAAVGFFGGQTGSSAAVTVALGVVEGVSIVAIAVGLALVTTSGSLLLLRSATDVTELRRAA